MSAEWSIELPRHAEPAPEILPVIAGSGICRHKVSEARGDPLSGDIVTALLGPIRICHIRARPHQHDRLHPLDSYASAPFLKIVLQQRGVAHLQQGHRRTRLEAGSWSVYDASRPYSVQNLEALEQFAILIPRDLKAPEIELGVKLVPDESMMPSGVSKVLFNAARSALAEAGGMDQAMRESLGDGILELAKLALFDRLGGAIRIPMRETFRERVKRHVIQNLGDSELSVDSIARKLDCSKRHLHKGFAESGTTLSQFIWTERLERARRDLASKNLAHRSITEIAFNWGFVNSAHFSRRFLRQYGVSPRDYRKQAIQQHAS